ncbi:hypothetical protein BB561_004028 [Smittium simulii]|uniref:Uncharacterized protein n=1 Tax=Smittium simulii TaxID=133385 RepID=A0A2T9YID4_9FUNG|nr:hypothetical protein BB561_004028 [Smittium simulii]
MSNVRNLGLLAPNKWNHAILLSLGVNVRDVGFYDVFNVKNFDLNIRDIVEFDKNNNVLNTQFGGKHNVMNTFHDNIQTMIAEVNLENIDYNILANNTANETNGVIFRALDSIIRRDNTNKETVRLVAEGLLIKYYMNRFHKYVLSPKPQISFFVGTSSYCIPDLVISDNRNNTRYILVEEDKQFDNTDPYFAITDI